MLDNLADIKLKLTCTNSMAAMNIIYMEQMKYHRMSRWSTTVPQSKGRSMDWLLGEEYDKDEEEEFLQPYIVSNPFEARELTYNAIDG